MAADGGTRLIVNGRAVAVAAPPATRLSAVLRDEIGLTGTKVGCDAGDCGACTVLVDGELACACLVSLAQAEGRRIVTVEGLATETKSGAALQESFLAHGAAQCGICTPGMLMTSLDLLRVRPDPTEAEIREGISAVLCRCTGYHNIVKAVQAGAAAMKR